MRKTAWLLLVFAAWLVGCAAGPTGPVPVSTATAVSVLTVTLANETTEVICSVYIAPVDRGEWGDNVLGPGEVVMPGDAAVFEVLPGTYDLRADNCFDYPLAQERTVEIAAPLHWVVVSAEPTRTFGSGLSREQGALPVR